jgi:hypothetical protein
MDSMGSPPSRSSGAPTCDGGPPFEGAARGVWGRGGWAVIGSKQGAPAALRQAQYSRAVVEGRAEARGPPPRTV